MSEKMSEMNTKEQLMHNEVLSVKQFMSDSALSNVYGLDLRNISSVSDYFLLATVNSYGQLRGAVKSLHEFFYRSNIDCRGGKKESADTNWLFLDCDYFIIHLMTEEARRFYDIEELWLKVGARVLE